MEFRGCVENEGAWRGSPNVLVGDADDMTDELADGVLEAGDWPHHIRNGVNLATT